MGTCSSQIRILALDDHALVRDGVAEVAGAAHASDPNKLLTHLLLRFKWARGDRGHAGLLSHLRVVTGRPGSRPRSEQTSHPVHTHLLANTRWVSAGRHVFDHANLRRFSLVLISSRRYLQVRWCSVSALAFACRCFKQTQSGSILADHAGGLWVVADRLVHLKDGVVTSHFAVEWDHGSKASAKILTALCG